MAVATLINGLFMSLTNNFENICGCPEMDRATLWHELRVLRRDPVQSIEQTDIKSKFPSFI